MRGVAGHARSFDKTFRHYGVADDVPVVARGDHCRLIEAIDQVLAGDADVVGVAAVAVEDDDLLETGLHQAGGDFADDMDKGVAG